MKIAKLDDATIHRLFGSFDAETEDEGRFTDYFVTNEFYERFVSDFPLRIAVGNKGTGKSAIIRRAYIDDMKRTDAVCVSMNAADLISRAGEIPKDGLKAINHWKVVFAREAASQMLTATIADNVDGEFAKAISSLPNFLALVGRLLSKKTGGATDIALKAGLDLARVWALVWGGLVGICACLGNNRGLQAVDIVASFEMTAFLGVPQMRRSSVPFLLCNGVVL